MGVLLRRVQCKVVRIERGLPGADEFVVAGRPQPGRDQVAAVALDGFADRGTLGGVLVPEREPGTRGVGGRTTEPAGVGDRRHHQPQTLG